MPSSGALHLSGGAQLREHGGGPVPALSREPGQAADEVPCPNCHQFLDSYTWVNPEDGSRVEIQFPVERIRYLPVPTD